MNRAAKILLLTCAIALACGCKPAEPELVSAGSGGETVSTQDAFAPNNVDWEAVAQVTAPAAEQEAVAYIEAFAERYGLETANIQWETSLERRLYLANEDKLQDARCVDVYSLQFYVPGEDVDLADSAFLVYLSAEVSADALGQPEVAVWQGSLNDALAEISASDESDLIWEAVGEFDGATN